MRFPNSIPKGTEIRNEAGELVCTFVADFYSGQELQPYMIMMADGSRLSPGMLIPDALIRYMRVNSHEVEL